ncbi:MAG: hypothetical protein JSS35_19595 [Proteobacteria bacterium]|nr:hypothetical protein [Pseudomonadota bacterium]
MTVVQSIQGPTIRTSRLARPIAALVGIAVAALIGGAAAAAECPYGNAYPDGCAEANPYGAFRQPQFLTGYARQSGQKWRTDHPQPWNVAGVDYPIGYDSRLKLKNPARDPLPAGCAFKADSGTAGAPAVHCGHVANLKLEGWDFSKDGGVQLILDPSLTGTTTVANNLFRRGPNLTGGNLVRYEGGTANFVFQSNVLDSNYPNIPDTRNGGMVDNRTGGTAVYRYNAILNSGQRPLAGLFPDGLEAAYNYWEGISMYYSPAGAHGEPIGAFYQPHAAPPYVRYLFNVMFVPGATSGPSITAVGPFINTGAFGVTLASAVVRGNTMVSNKRGGASGFTAESALLGLRIGSIGTLTVQDNYVDPTGALYCVTSDSTAQKIVGSISGHILTVTDLSRTGEAILPGAILYGYANPLKGAPVIQPFGAEGTTGRGGIGTYALSGPPQNVAGKEWMTNAAIGTFTFSGNKNLRDGSTITIDGPQFNQGVCNGRGG